MVLIFITLAVTLCYLDISVACFRPIRLMLLHNIGVQRTNTVCEMPSLYSKGKLCKGRVNFTTYNVCGRSMHGMLSSSPKSKVEPMVDGNNSLANSCLLAH